MRFVSRHIHNFRLPKFLTLCCQCDISFAVTISDVETFSCAVNGNVFWEEEEVVTDVVLGDDLSIKKLMAVHVL